MQLKGHVSMFIQIPLCDEERKTQVLTTIQLKKTVAKQVGWMQNPTIYTLQFIRGTVCHFGYAITRPFPHPLPAHQRTTFRVLWWHRIDSTKPFWCLSMFLHWLTNTVAHPDKCPSSIDYRIIETQHRIAYNVFFVERNIEEEDA